MFAYDDPFWFVSSELLTSLFHAEIDVVTQLLTKNPDLPNLLDAPEATIPERTECFALLAHREIVVMIDDKFVARYEDSPSLNDIESNILKRTYGLVPADAPAWVLGMHKVIEQLATHIHASLPEPLRMGGYNPDNAEQMQAIESAKKTLCSIEQIQALTAGVLNQQLQRLEGRWKADRPVASHQETIERGRRGPSKKKVHLTRDKIRIARDKAIAEIEDAAETIGEFLQLMDERNVKPQPTWSMWPGTWLKAYKDPHLRRLIHQDKSRALARAQRQR